MRLESTMADIGVGLVGGFVGTNIMEPVSMQLYEWGRKRLASRRISNVFHCR